MNQTITALETLVLTAIFCCETHDGSDPVDNPIWVEYLVDDSGLNAAQLGGVMASLTKKGLVQTDGGKTCSANEEAFNLLPAQMQAVIARPV